MRFVRAQNEHARYRKGPCLDLVKHMHQKTSMSATLGREHPVSVSRLTEVPDDLLLWGSADLPST